MIIAPDVSEWEGQINWPALVAGLRQRYGAAVAIARCWNGGRTDYQWPRNRSQAHAAGVDALGIYAYLPAGTDPAAQARDLVEQVGVLLPNEWLILDLEEGSGDQSALVRTWMGVVQASEPRPGWLYTGLAWFREHNLAADGVPASREWIAAYQSGEPSSPSHGLWQFTDSGTLPGVSGPCDLSQFDGQLADLLAAIGATPTPKPPVEDDMPQWIPNRLRDDQQATTVLVPAGAAWNAYPHRNLHVAGDGYRADGVAGSTTEVHLRIEGRTGAAGTGYTPIGPGNVPDAHGRPTPGVYSVSVVNGPVLTLGVDGMTALSITRLSGGAPMSADVEVF